MSTSTEEAAMADEFAADAASFVAAVESVAAGTNPSAAVSVLILALSGLLASGAKLGAMEDVAGAAGAALGEGASDRADYLRAPLAEQFGAADAYRQVVDPYVTGDVGASRLSEDVAEVCGDLLQGLAWYGEGLASEALAWWQYAYLSNWGPAASESLRAVQSLMALVRLGAPKGSADTGRVG